MKNDNDNDDDDDDNDDDHDDDDDDDDDVIIAHPYNVTPIVLPEKHHDIIT